MNILISPKTIGRIGLILGAIIVTNTLVNTRPAQAAACQTPSQDYGTVTTTIAIPGTATYRVWSRMMVPDTTNTSYLLEIDGANCFVVGGSMPLNTWTWMASTTSATSTGKVDINLSQGSHVFKLIGNKPDVKLDRLILTSDLSCTPTGSNDDCNATADTTPPTVSLTAPAENSSLTGTVTVGATATDDVAINRVEFYANSKLIGTATRSPYNISWDTTTVQNGQSTLTVKAYDAAGNVSSDAYIVTIQNGDAQAPSVPANVMATASTYNKVTLNWQASTDNVGVTGYVIVRNGTPLTQVGTTTTYSDSTVMANTQYSYQLKALDAAGNQSALSSAATVTTPTIPDTQPPTTPTNLSATAVSSSQINLSWQASTDNAGPVKYDIYQITGTKGTPQRVATVTSTSFGKTGLRAATTYSYFVKAKDASGNQSAASNMVSATTLGKKHYSTLLGKVVDTASSSISGANATLTSDGKEYRVKTDSRGHYQFSNLAAGTYSVTYQAKGYKSQSISTRLSGSDIKRKNITLTKR